MDERKLNPRHLIVITHDWHMNRAKALTEPIFADTLISWF